MDFDDDKTISDRQFALNLLREQSAIAEREGFTGAERHELRELLRDAPVLREIVDERAWQAGTWSRMGKFGKHTKAIFTTIITIAGVAAALSAIRGLFGNG